MNGNHKKRLPWMPSRSLTHQDPDPFLSKKWNGANVDSARSIPMDALIMLWMWVMPVPYVCLCSPQFSQYIDMLRSHVSYWTNKSLANFLLHQLLLNPDAERLHSTASIPDLSLDPTTESV